jgi:hypothetical protein
MMQSRTTALSELEKLAGGDSELEDYDGLLDPFEDDLSENEDDYIVQHVSKQQQQHRRQSPNKSKQEKEDHTMLNITSSSSSTTTGLSPSSIYYEKPQLISPTAFVGNEINSPGNIVVSPGKSLLDDSVKDLFRQRIKEMLVDEEQNIEQSSPKSIRQKNVVILEAILKDIQSNPTLLKRRTSPKKVKKTTPSDSKNTNSEAAANSQSKSSISSNITTKVTTETKRIVRTQKSPEKIHNDSALSNEDYLKFEEEQSKLTRQNLLREQSEQRKKLKESNREVEHEFGGTEFPIDPKPIHIQEEKIRKMVERDIPRSPQESEFVELARLEREMKHKQKEELELRRRQQEAEIRLKEEKRYQKDKELEQIRKREEVELKKRLDQELEDARRSERERKEQEKKIQSSIDSERRHREELEKVEDRKHRNLKKLNDQIISEQQRISIEFDRKQKELHNNHSINKSVTMATPPVRDITTPSRSIQSGTDEYISSSARKIRSDFQLSPYRAVLHRNLDSELEDLKSSIENNKRMSDAMLVDILPERSPQSERVTTKFYSRADDPYYDRTKLLEMSTLNEREHLKKCLHNAGQSIIECKKVTSLLESRIELLRQAKKDLNASLVQLEQDPNTGFYDKNLVKDEIDYQNDELLIVYNRVQSMAEELEELMLMKISHNDARKLKNLGHIAKDQYDKNYQI